MVIASRKYIAHEKLLALSFAIHYNEYHRETRREKERFMGHCINYIVVDKDTSKQEVLADIEAASAYDNHGYSNYSGGMKWHEDKVYADYAQAKEAICLMNNGWYDDHAVLFHDCENLENSVTRRLAKQIEDAKEKMREYIAANHVTSRKSAFIGCPRCQSKLSRKHLRSDLCPVCRTDLRSATVLGRIQGYKDKIFEWEKKILDEKKKLGKTAPVKWLVKYEYHI